MFSSRGEYDRGVNTFSPEGRIFQVEYALEAIKLGSTTIGIHTKEGCVLVVEKRVGSKLLESDSIEKIMEIDRHIGVATSGLTADAATIVSHAQTTGQIHQFTYNEDIPVASLTQAVADRALQFGESVTGEEPKMSRPFGVALLITGYDAAGTHLFHVDPSGTMVRYAAKAIGSGSEGAQHELKEAYRDDLSLTDASILALRILRQVMEEPLDTTNAQLAQVVPGSGFKVFSADELAALLEQVPPANTGDD